MDRSSMCCGRPLDVHIQYMRSVSTATDNQVPLDFYVDWAGEVRNTFPRFDFLGISGSHVI